MNITYDPKLTDHVITLVENGSKQEVKIIPRRELGLQHMRDSGNKLLTWYQYNEVTVKKLNAISERFYERKLTHALMGGT